MGIAQTQNPEAGGESDPRSLVLPPGGYGEDGRRPSALPISSHSCALRGSLSETLPGSQPFVKGDRRPQNPHRRQSPIPFQDVQPQVCQVQRSHIQGISSRMGQAVMRGVSIRSCMC